MKKIFLIACLVLLNSVNVFAGERLSPAATREIMKCKPLMQIITSDNIDKYINPDMASVEEVIQMQHDSREIVDCFAKIESMGVKIPDSLEAIKSIVIIHSYFNNMSSGNSLLRFKNENRRILKKLHHAILLPPPQGFAFVRINVEREAPGVLPDIDLFMPGGRTEENEPGKTYMVRYIKIEAKFSAKESEDKLTKYYEKTIDHEIVHAYMNSLLGIEHYKDLPKWFEEGCALYLAGNEPEVSTSASDDVQATRSLTDDYKDYLFVFEYLSKTKDDLAFRRFITQSILQSNVEGPLLTLTGRKSYVQVLKDAEHWKMINGARILCYVIMVIFLIYAFDCIGKNDKDVAIVLAVIVCLLAIFTFFILPGL